MVSITVTKPMRIGVDLKLAYAIIGRPKAKHLPEAVKVQTQTPSRMS